MVKQVFQYQKKTIILGIEWRNNLANYQSSYLFENIIDYTNNNFAIDLIIERSTTRYCLFIRKVIAK